MIGRLCSRTNHECLLYTKNNIDNLYYKDTNNNILYMRNPKIQPHKSSSQRYQITYEWHQVGYPGLAMQL